MSKIGILEPRDFSPRALDALAKIGSVELFYGDDLARFLSDKTVLFVRLAHHLNQAFFAQAPLLSILVSPTTGLTHIDLNAAAERSIKVLSLKGEVDFLRSITASSEHCLGLILALLRNYNNAFLRPENVHWDRDSVRGHDVRGSRIGIIGFGRIGQWLARVLSALEADVAYFDPQPSITPPYAKAHACADMMELIEWSRCVVLAASYQNGTSPIINRDVIDRMQGRYLVNIGRGELIDERHLLRRISESWFDGVALDVLTAEPKSEAELAEILALTRNHNFIVTPHVGGATFESSHRTEEYMVDLLPLRARLTEL